MGKYFDGFIEQQDRRGIPVTKELLMINQALKVEDEAKRRYDSRGFWCRIGLHWRVCFRCYRHLL